MESVRFTIKLKVTGLLREILRLLTLSLPETQIAEFANSVDLDEVAHNEPPHLDLHYLPSSLEFSV